MPLVGGIHEPLLTCYCWNIAQNSLHDLLCCCEFSNIEYLILLSSDKYEEHMDDGDFGDLDLDFAE